jgi:hypothetical protein
MTPEIRTAKGQVKESCHRTDVIYSLGQEACNSFLPSGFSDGLQPEPTAFTQINPLPLVPKVQSFAIVSILSSQALVIHSMAAPLSTVTAVTRMRRQPARLASVNFS